MTMFKAEGRFPVVITDVCFADPKFAKDIPGAFDVCVKVRHKDDPAQEDYWYGEYSTRYGVGVVSDKTQIQLTMNTLHEIGFVGNDLSTLKDQLVGKETFATTKAATSTQGNTFYNVKYLGSGGGNEPKPISQEEMFRRAKMMMEAPAAQAPAQGSNPFAGAAPAAPAQASAQAPTTIGNPFAANVPF
jgi:hypothetical protein